MKFALCLWLISGLGLILLTGRTAVAEVSLSLLPETMRVETKQKLGGISAAYYVQYIDQLHSSSIQEGALFQVFGGYETAHRNDLVLQLVEALSSQQFLEQKRAAIGWSILDALQTGEKARVAVLPTQALQLEAQAVEPTDRKAYFLQQLGLVIYSSCSTCTGGGGFLAK